MATPPVESITANTSIPKAKAAGLEKNLRTVATGGSATFASKLVLDVLRFVMAIWLARLLGAHQLGLYNLGQSALNLGMGIALFGLDAGVIRFIAIHIARKDEDGAWGTIQVGFGISLLFSTVLGITLYAFAQEIAVYFFKEADLAPLLQLASVFVPLFTINDMLGNALKGFKKIQWSSLAMFIYQPVSRLIMIAIITLIGMTTSLAIITYGLSTLVSSLAMLVYLQRHFNMKRPFGFSRNLAKDIVRFSFPVWLSGLMSKFQANIQSIFIGSMNTITGVGIFGVASQITMVSGEFSSSINTSSKPVIAELHEHGDIEQMGHIYQAANKWVVTVQLPIFLLIVLFPAALLSLFGESFTGGATALIILAVADLLNTATGMGGIIIDMTGYTKLKLINSIVRLALYIALDVWLIPRWGILGAAVAVMAGEGVINIARLVQVYVLFRILPFNLSFLKPLTSTAAALAVVLVVRPFISLGSDIVKAAALGLILLLIYAAVVMLLGFTTEEQALIKNVVRSILRRKAK